MAICPKCHAVNDEGLTRCRACNAILPVKIGSKSPARWERVRRRPDLVGLTCPSCGVRNPYSRLHCQACNALLAEHKGKVGLGRAWIYAAIGVLIIATIAVVALRVS